MSIATLGFKPFTYPSRQRPLDSTLLAIDPKFRDRLASISASNPDELASARLKQVGEFVRENGLSIHDEATLYLKVLRLNSFSGGGGSVSLSAPEAAEFGQRQVQTIKDAIKGISIGLNQLKTVDELRARYGDDMADRYEAGVRKSIQSDRNAVSGAVQFLVDVFDASGPIVSEREDGNFDLNAFVLRRTEPGASGKDRSVMLFTPGSDPPGDGAAFSLVELLDGAVRQRTELSRPGQAVSRQA